MRQTNIKMPKDLIDRLDAESDRSGVPKSEMVRRAIKTYLDEIERERRREARRPACAR